MSGGDVISEMLLGHRVAQFLYREAELLDRWLIDEWEALFPDDAAYLVPPTDHVDDDADPKKTLFYICDDRVRLRERIVRLAKQGAHAENPRSKTRHMVSNVMAFQTAKDIEARSSFAVWRTRDGNSDIFIGHYLHKLVEVDGAFRIREKKCVLDMDALRPHARISILL